MKNLTFIQILKTLSKKEFKRFQEFINSPFHNKSNNVIKLFDAVKGYYPNFNQEDFNLNSLYETVFPGKNYNEQLLRNLMTSFLKLEKDFLALLEYEIKDNERSINILAQLNARGMDSTFKRVLSDEEKKLSKLHNLDHNFFEQLTDIENSKVQFALSRNLQSAISGNVLHRGNFFIYSFILNLFIELHDIKVGEISYNSEFKDNLPEEISRMIDFELILKHVKRNHPQFYKIYSVLFYAGMSYVDMKNDDYYFKFKKTFFKNISMFSKAEQYKKFIALETCCVFKIILGKEQFSAERLDIYMELIKRDLYRSSDTGHNYFGIDLFRNVTDLAAKLGNLSWLEEFLTKYHKELAPAYREPMLNYGLAQLSFAKGHFESSLVHINKIHYKEFVYKLPLKHLVLKIYYELDDYNSALYLIDTFKHFLSKNKNVSGAYKELNMNFLHFYNELFKMKEDNTGKADADYLKKRVSDIPFIIQRPWLLQKIKELK